MATSFIEVMPRNAPAKLAAMLLATAWLLGCSGDWVPVEPSEPVEPVVILDLVENFSDAVPVFAGAGGASSSSPRVNPDRRMVHVPYGWDLTYELEVPPGGVVSTQEAKPLGSSVGRLEVAWTPHGGAERILTRDLTATPDRDACFANTSSEKGRLVLRAKESAGSAQPQAGIRVFSPQIVAGIECETPVAASIRAPGDARPNIVVYLIDALRADHLGCYGHTRNTSPHIDAFSESAVVFTRAQAQTSWTRPAVASIFTGLLPQQHMAIDRNDTLPESAITLAELLTADGYQTAGVVANGNVAQVYGFSQGFSYYKYLEQVQMGQHVVRSDDVNDAAFSWLDEERGPNPFFLYIHTVDPHLPYDPPEPHRSAFAADVDDPELGSVERVNQVAADRNLVTPNLITQLKNLYAGEVAANDASFGELLRGLEERGLSDDTVIVLVSDHGEEFFDHNGWTHGNTLFAEMLDVPLIISIPGSGPGVVSEIVQHVDLFATLLDLAGAESRHGVFGRSARALWERDQSTEWNNRGVAHLDLKKRYSISWVDPDWKLMVRRLKDDRLKTLLFSRVDDPGELHNVADANRGLAEDVLSRYHEAVSHAGDALAGAEVDVEQEAEIEAQLKALGYL